MLRRVRQRQGIRLIYYKFARINGEHGEAGLDQQIDVIGRFEMIRVRPKSVFVPFLKYRPGGGVQHFLRLALRALKFADRLLRKDRLHT